MRSTQSDQGSFVRRRPVCPTAVGRGAVGATGAGTAPRGNPCGSVMGT
ncbi:hypothetical protein SHJG_2137 [Streptomyces hygroscopicus subsp. jinggangensis 5008]|nr:hypothetical protein SHJG_2137 [Streptomyces hygroscopicus subsp. jinggangensis 5008]AGF61568.1 hypothetical protein SHJGH_1902 [Streptomyces hygroscopicus subsp. jinggangensis TL01]